MDAKLIYRSGPDILCNTCYPIRADSIEYNGHPTTTSRHRTSILKTRSDSLCGTSCSSSMSSSKIACTQMPFYLKTFPSILPRVERKDSFTLFPHLDSLKRPPRQIAGDDRLVGRRLTATTKARTATLARTPFAGAAASVFIILFLNVSRGSRRADTKKNGDDR